MTSSKIVLVLGILLAIGMVAWGVSGIVLGKVITKSYETINGERRHFRLVRRDEEPVWFWIVCSVYVAVGIAILVMVYLLLGTPAFSN
ncbi:MAG TPA: hypothetical protein VEG37_11035 [Burkholderiales bacterium]|nr:hypothetical protein [Burkholderiales bacterium]